MNPEGEYYDPEEDVRPLSPGLVPTQVSYKPEETPPPYIPTSSSSSASVSPEPGESNGDGMDASIRPAVRKKLRKKRRRKGGRTRPAQGDAYLLSILDPNRPDIAREAAQRALNSASQSEAEDEVEKDMSGGGDDEDDRSAKENDRSGVRVAQLKSIAWDSPVDVVMDEPATEKLVVSASLAMHAVNGTLDKHSLSNDDTTRRASLTVMQNANSTQRSLHSAQPLKIVPATPESKAEGEDDSIATSPALAKFAISAAEANPDSTLPAMQKSPPRSTSTHSPDGIQSLPSLQTALGQIVDTPTIAETPNGLSPFSQNPSQSPTMTRSPYVTGNAGPSPGAYSQPSPASSKDMTSMSPPGYPSHSGHQTYWRNASKEGSFSTTSPVAVPGLAPVTAYPTPKDIASPESATTPQALNGPLSANGPFTSSTFKCTHPGCTAQPFQTQYLLNSHANVHSSSRPHYCPVKSCARSFGGRGFKRKNEMIRHGLVHDSPGYVCPFCADQQHKYPRPDNLQRYVPLTPRLSL
jgi:hypothetical protein